MINSLIEAIATAIAAEFGDDYTIYREATEQGMQEPCFFVQVLKPSMRMFYGGIRYFQTNPFCIQYFPTDRLNARYECSEVADTLYECLEYITESGDLVRGTDMHYEIVDGILSFFVNYDLFLRKETEEIPKMETLDQTIDVNE